MTAEERKAAVRRVIDEVWNKGNLDAVDELYAGHCSFHDPSFAFDGVMGLRDQVRQLRTANTNLHIDVHDVIVDADMSAARWTMGGTATGEFRGLPATGKTYVMTGMTCQKWEGDRVVEEWVNYDLLGALQQLGIIPEMAPQQSSG